MGGNSLAASSHSLTLRRIYRGVRGSVQRPIAVKDMCMLET